MRIEGSNLYPSFLAFRRLAGLFVLSQILFFTFFWRFKTQESPRVNKLRRKIKDLVFQKVTVVGTSVASNRQRLSQRSCQEGQERTLAPTWLHSTPLKFTLAIASEVPSTQLISDLSNPYSAHNFFHDHFEHMKIVIPCTCK